MPEELTPEEIEREKKRNEEKARKVKEEVERKEKQGVGVVRPVQLAENLRKKLVDVKKKHNDTDSRWRGKVLQNAVSLSR